MTNALSIPIRSSTLSSFIGSKTPSFHTSKAACSSSSVRFPKIKACVIEPEPDQMDQIRRRRLVGRRKVSDSNPWPSAQFSSSGLLSWK
ncbi:hypothetical protein Tco_0472933 [Tanacetum coccineum]